MQSSTFVQRLYTCLLVVVLCVSVAVAHPPKYYTPTLKFLLDKRQPLTQCETRQLVALMCYQCGKSHEEEFDAIYGSCCRGQELLELEMRQYCEERFIEPPKRGGLWA